MSERALIEAELTSVRAELSETFPHLSDDILAYAPAEGMRTVQGQFVEILTTEDTVLDSILGRPRRGFPEVEDAFWAIQTVDGLIEAAGALRERTLSALREADLDAPASVSQGLREWLRLQEVPTGELFRYISRHESYHTGQLFSYLWAMGKNPYDWP